MRESKGSEASRPSSRRLRALFKQARKQRKSARGWRQRLRRSFRAAWLWLLVRAAEATLKRWLAVLGVACLLYLALFFAQQEEGSPKLGLTHEFAIESEEFLPSIAGATGALAVPGNQIDVFVNGDQYYPAILDAINTAQHTIDIEGIGA